jgi:nucleotide-binding universal stress UspA family protein
MLTIKKILHPTDFSEHARYAYDLACALARDHKSQLVVLHVRTPQPMIYGDGMIVPPDEGFQEEMRRRLANMPDPSPDVHVERHLVDGEAVPEILKFAEENDCDMIVMGTHGWTGFSRLLLGSVAEKVVRKADCPVITVKNPTPLAAAETEETAGQQAQ